MAISDDAILNEQRGLIYSIQMAMDENKIAVNGKDVQLMAGIAVMAEMQTGEGIEGLLNSF